jgi:NTE family protein
MKKKLGLALGSGGSRGTAHIGFLQALEENDIKVNFISGTSMGAVVGACYSKGMSPIEMRDKIFELKTRDLFDLDLMPLTRLGLLRSQKVRTLIQELLGEVEFKTLKIPFKCVAVDILTGKELTLEKDKNLVDSVLASSAIPSIFRPIKMDDMLLVDGGIANRVPVNIVKDMGADVVIGIDVLGTLQEVEEVKNVFSVILRMIDIMDFTNSEKRRKEEEDLIDLWIEPEMGNLSQYNIKTIEKAYEAGYQAGITNIKKIKELLK